MGGPILLFAFCWHNWRNPLLRSESARANECFVLIAMLLPTIALVAGPGTGSPRTRALLRLLLDPTALAGLVGSLFVRMWLPETIRRGTHPLLEPVMRYPLEYGQLTIYRANCGMPFCDNNTMVVRAELPVLPGIVWVRDVRDEWRVLMYKHVDHHLRQFGI